MKTRSVVLLRGNADKDELALIERLKDEGDKVRYVNVPEGKEWETEPCHKAYSKHDKLLEPYGPSMRNKIASNGVAGMAPVAPEGYRVERKGAYYRLFSGAGEQVNPKAMRKTEFLAFLDAIT